MFFFQGSLQVRSQLNKEETHVFTINTENFANRRLHHLKINREGRGLTIQVPYFLLLILANVPCVLNTGFLNFAPKPSEQAKFWGCILIIFSPSLWRTRIVVLRAHPAFQKHLWDLVRNANSGSYARIYLTWKFFFKKGQQVMLLHVQFWQPLNCGIMTKISKEEIKSDQQGLRKECAQVMQEHGGGHPPHLGISSVHSLNKEGMLGSLTLHSVKKRV